jgi:hypothetical protein
MTIFVQPELSKHGMHRQGLAQDTTQLPILHTVELCHNLFGTPQQHGQKDQGRKKHSHLFHFIWEINLLKIAFVDICDLALKFKN